MSRARVAASVATLVLAIGAVAALASCRSSTGDGCHFSSQPLAVGQSVPVVIDVRETTVPKPGLPGGESVVRTFDGLNVNAWYYVDLGTTNARTLSRLAVGAHQGSATLLPNPLSADGTTTEYGLRPIDIAVEGKHLHAVAAFCG